MRRQVSPRGYWRLGLVLSTVLLGPGVAVARRPTAPRPARPDAIVNPGIPHPASADSVAIRRVDATPKDDQAQLHARAKVQLVLFTDNHGTNCDRPKDSGPDAPVPPLMKLIPLSWFVPVPMNNLGCKYLPFSTQAFPQDMKNPSTAIYGYGLLVKGGIGNANSGFIPQSSLPLGVPLAPETPANDLSELKEALRNLLSMLSSPEAVTAPAGQALEATVRDRDVRVAAKNMPQPSANRPKARG